MNEKELEELKNQILKTIHEDPDYYKEYQCETLFQQIIDGIVESDDVIGSIVNVLYSYNAMLTSIVSTISKDADENTVALLVQQLKDMLE